MFSYIWTLFFSQRYGPPPSYPHLKIPGLNAPIPPGASFGYHPGGWGKPPVDEVSLWMLSIFILCFLVSALNYLTWLPSKTLLFPKSLKVCVFCISMGTHCMEMSLAFSNKNSQIMRYLLWFFLLRLSNSFRFFLKIKSCWLESLVGW